MRLLKDRRKALSKILTALTIILVSGTTACCSVGHRVDSHPVSTNPHESFIFVLNKEYIKQCAGTTCMEGVRVSSGSGFAVANIGGHTLAVTAGHLCLPDPNVYKQEFKITVLGGSQYMAHPIMTVPSTDTCVLMVGGVELPPVRIAESEPERGERVYALSAPYGIFDPNMIPMFEGFYSGYSTKKTPPGGIVSVMSLDAYTIPSRPGSSGGPILNSRGEVIGMVVMAHPGFENYTLSPRQQALKEVLNIVVMISKSDVS